MSAVTSTNALVKDSTVQTLNGKLDNLNATLGGNANIAPVFNTATAYSKGDMVNYNGDLYVFTSNHSVGAWTGNDVVQTKVSTELSTLNSNLTTLANKAMNPYATTELATILTSENIKSVTPTVNGFVSVSTNNVVAAATTVSFHIRNLTQSIGAAGTYYVGAYTGAYLACVPVNAGDSVTVDINGHTVDATILQTGTTPT